ncbi:hypothetical protein CTheo_8270 [Ceratobasidium theobromae]|uniref:Uncharacterized protein n=1 Tax=Ceratobasidium theobromae TaxID=1582974 RepID=A0A5N5Q986_9AGAM|nr:hypothetical protein CTheo_8270 [Ceratobasidium theobromae]
MRLTEDTPGPPTHSMATIDKHDKQPDDSDERSRLLDQGPSNQPFDPPDYADLPPEFAPYQAEYQVTSSGDIFSHDPHLNQDGEALYQFLVSHATTPPVFLLKCRGTHPETRVRHVTRTETHNGQTVTRTEPEMYTETIIDFEFSIDISRHILRPGVLWTVPDDELTYRGKMKREVLTDAMGGIRRVSRRVLKAGEVWREKREKWGLPPWLSQVEQPAYARTIQPSDEKMPMRSELTLRQWADRYCASHKSLKSFRFAKVGRMLGGYSV